MEKVIFDTNSIRNSEPMQFLGGRTELEKFSKVAELIFPDMVLDEIKNQKRRNLINKKKSFLDNPFHWLRQLDEDGTKNFDIEGHVDVLESQEALPYKIIELTDYSCLRDMKELALKKLPPFVPQDGSDKGFKDAYIYFTVIEYLQSIDDKYVFFVTDDGLFKEAFKANPNVYVIKDFNEFMMKSITVFHDDYFIEKLQLEIHTDITKESILDYWVNINDNQVLLLDVNGDHRVVEIDSKEIVKYDDVNAYSDAIDSLIKSTSFDKTHIAIEELTNYIDYLSDDEIIQILEATRENNQIFMIIDDEDVKQFIVSLYEKKKDILSSDLEAYIKMKLE